MKAARVGTALLAALVSTALCWVALDTWIGQGHDAPPMPWTALAGTLVLAVVVVAAGLPMRRWRSSRPTTMKRPIDPLVAARTAVLAKAAAYGGALILGWYLAQALVLLPDLVGDRRTRFVVALVAASAAVGLGVAGFVVQHWCRVPPDERDRRDRNPGQDADDTASGDVNP